MTDTVGFRISFSEQADAVELAAVHAESLPPGWSAGELAAFCGRDNGFTLKAGRHDVICAFLVIQCAGDEAEILALAVKPEERRKGVAASLFTEAIRVFRERGIVHIYLEVAEGNCAARAFYERQGFGIVARREGYYRTTTKVPESALIMRLDICRDVSQGEEQSGVVV